MKKRAAKESDSSSDDDSNSIMSGAKPRKKTSGHVSVNFFWIERRYLNRAIKRDLP